MLNAFSTAVMVRRGRTVGNLMASLRVANDKLRERAVRVCVAATGRPEPDAREALAAANDDVRVAILMLARRARRAGRRARLEAHGGAIGRAYQIGLDQSLTTR